MDQPETEKVEGTEEVVDKPAAPSLAEVAKEFASAVTKAMPVAAAPAAPVTAAPVIDWEAEHKAAKAKVDELSADGKVGEATEYWTNYVLRRQSANQGDASTNPVVISQLETVKREVKRDNARSFELYGPEIQAEIDKLPLTEKLKHESWEAALEKVQGRHLKEILAAEEARWDKEKGSKLTGATAQGSRGSRPGINDAGAGNDDGLDDMERGVAKSFGVDPKKYAESKKLMDNYKMGDGNYKDVPLTSTGSRIQPGQF